MLQRDHWLQTQNKSIQNGKCIMKPLLYSDVPPSMHRCNELVCLDSAANNGFNQKFLTMMRPSALHANSGDYYKDAYLRQYQNKLHKLQSFLSTPDLTSESGSSERTSCIEYDGNRGAGDIQLLRPDVIQMNAFQMSAQNRKSYKHPALLPPPPPPIHVYQCHHHHQHNQNSAMALNTKPNEAPHHKRQQNTTSPVTSTRF